jgi:hypothetical protein
MRVVIATALAVLGMVATTAAARAAAVSADPNATICVDVYPISVLGQPITSNTYEICLPA